MSATRKNYRFFTVRYVSKKKDTRRRRSCRRELQRARRTKKKQEGARFSRVKERVHWSVFHATRLYTFAPSFLSSLFLSISLSFLLLLKNRTPFLPTNLSLSHNAYISTKVLLAVYPLC